MRHDFRLLTAIALAFATACGETSAPSAASENPGRDAFRRACAVCHITADPSTPNGRIRLVGPNLHGVYGAPAARRSDFAYSKALRESGVTWNDAALNAYIERPSAFIPGNRMSFTGESDAQTRAAIIDYLKSLDS